MWYTENERKTNANFGKKLYLLIPFYIFNFEKKFKKYSMDDAEYENLKKEFQYISSELKRLSDTDEISAYDRRKMEELSKMVIDFIAQNHEKIRKGIGDIMRGPMIETEVDKLVRPEREKAAKAWAEVDKARRERQKAIELMRSLGVSEEKIRSVYSTE